MTCAVVPVVTLIPTYNRAELIGEAIDSVLGQTMSPTRVLVIDDGSTDDVPAALVRFGDRVEYRRKENAGKAAALNMGLSISTEPLVWIFDDDDVAAPDALERMVAALDSHQQCGFAFGEYTRFEDDPATGKRRHIPAEWPDIRSETILPAVLERCFIFQGAMLVRRTCYEAVGPFDEALVRSQDYEMLIRLARAFTGIQVHGILFYQRHHPGTRGTAARVIAFAETESVAHHQDRRIVCEQWPPLALHEFLPRVPHAPVEEPLGERRATALLQKFVVFARRDAWDTATEAFREFRDAARDAGMSQLSPAETAALSRVFDTYSRGLPSLRRQREFPLLLAGITPAQLRSEIRAALAWPLVYRMKLALAARSLPRLLDAMHAMRHCLDFMAVLLLARAKRDRRRQASTLSAAPVMIPGPPCQGATETRLL